MKHLVCTFLTVVILAVSSNTQAQDSSSEAESDKSDITATLTARTTAGFVVPKALTVEIGEDMVADQNLYDQAVRSLNGLNISIADDAEMTLQIDFDAEPLGDSGRQISGIGDRAIVDERRIYSGDADPYTGESYLSEQEFGVTIGIGRGNRKALGVDYSLVVRIYTLAGEVMWSGSAGAVIVGATPEVVGEAMLEQLLKEMGNSVAAKRVVLNSDPAMSIGQQPSNREKRPARQPRGGSSASTAPPAVPKDPPALTPNQGLF